MGQAIEEPKVRQFLFLHSPDDISVLMTSGWGDPIETIIAPTGYLDTTVSVYTALYAAAVGQMSQHDFVSIPPGTVDAINEVRQIAAEGHNAWLDGLPKEDVDDMVDASQFKAVRWNGTEFEPA